MKVRMNVKMIKAQTADEIIKKNARKLTNKFVKRALAKNADKVLMHAIDKLIPDAKQELKISGGLKIVKVNAFDPDGSK